FSGPKTSIICSPMTSLKTSIKTITYLSDIGCLEIQGASLVVEHPHILDIAQQAMRDCDIEPELKPIRGGTDGAQLSFMGLPCPNLFTGGYNYHGKHEFVTLEGMEKAVQVIVRIAELTAQRK
ncbi:M20/M25/M40 family metallo-hydrolase, partial [Escherichia coli]|uniref:M20/M25/M40 family metallo-hydrolase n=1 Tax=Escherichia coli TaxID=562 RepID=UPI0039EE5678